MSRNITILEDNWKFHHDYDGSTGEFLNSTITEVFEDSSWKSVSVPHDWAIEGPFSPDHDPQFVKVHADGILRETSHIGRTGGLPIVGTGIYRTKFRVAELSKNIFLEFDGVMSYSEIYVNGQLVGGRPYGYTSFSVDITKEISFQEENLLVVVANPKPTSSRWYTGAGIYRPVRLVELQEAFVSFNGTYITSIVENNKGKVTSNTEFSTHNSDLSLKVVEELYAPNGSLVGSQISELSENIKTEFTVDNPQLWEINSPNLYKSVVKISKDQLILDEYTTFFGIRTVEITREHGFVLNGKYMKLKGMCLHHDLGALGAAAHVSAIHRQLKRMKEMGVNAIRCTHNPFSREFMDLCDQMGFLVIAEAFDEWKIPKVPNGYAILFDEWGEKDLVDLIRRDRNHPCVIMWSLGNEIRDQNEIQGKETAKFLCDISHREDATRPTTFGINNPEKAIELGFCDVVDVVGFNYQANNYEKYLREHPNWIIYGSETSSTVSSRHVYHFPAECDFPVEPHPSGHMSSYDLSGPKWSYTPEKEFAAQEKFPELLGSFTWTGFDYLGEPTPFRNQWPSHVSYFGVVDLAGIPKDRYYAFQARWLETPVLHIFPHWNWHGYSKIDVHGHSNCHSVELFVNGISQGMAFQNQEIEIGESNGKCDEVEKYRFIWKDVPYIPGELLAVGYDKEGNIIKTHEIKTAKDPYQIVLIPEESSVKVGEMSYIRAQVLDEDGNLCYHADHTISFHVSGVGEYISADSGDQTSTRRFSEEFCPVFHGELTLIVKGTREGLLFISADSGKLEKSKISIMVK